MNNDHTPQFLRQFYDSLKVISQEFFLGRSKTSLVPEGSSSQVEAVFDRRQASSYIDRASVMDELMDTRVAGTFSASDVASRIENSAAAIAGGQASHILLPKAPMELQSVSERIAALAEVQKPAPAAQVQAPVSQLSDSLMREFVALVHEEVQLRSSIARLKTSRNDKDSSKIPTFEQQLQACLARKNTLSTRIKLLSAQAPAANQPSAV